MKYKNYLSAAFLLILCLSLIFVLASCDTGDQEDTSNAPTITISEDGYWVIDGEKTDFKAEASGTPENSELDFFPTDDGTYIVSVGNAKYLSNIVIPSTYNGRAVVGIADEAFLDCTRLRSITIPDTIHSIGRNAFMGCTSLESIYITDLAAWCEIDSPYSSAPSFLYSLYLDGDLVTELVIPDGVGIPNLHPLKNNGAF